MAKYIDADVCPACGSRLNFSVYTGKKHCSVCGRIWSFEIDFDTSKYVIRMETSKHMKYIDADRLRAEIERRMKNWDKPTIPKGIDSPYCTLKGLLPLIDSLQPEQPEVDLEEEADRLFFSLGWYEGDHDQPMLDCISLEEFRGIARHFFELGQRDAANKYDEIEYNRKRAEGEMLGKTLDEAAEEYAYNNWEDNDYHTGASEGLHFDAIGHTANCFKAGAKWMAEQGVSWEDKMTYYDGFLLYGKDERAFTMEGNFNEGDIVIVQIRKKEESK